MYGKINSDVCNKPVAGLITNTQDIAGETLFKKNLY